MNFRQKGFQFERKMAGKISEWWCGNKKGLWRNTTSGARATVMGEVFGGDIIPAMNIALPWPLSIELKKTEQWSIENFFNLNPGEPLLKYMIQCLQSASLGCNERAMLICAKNHKKPLCFLHYHAFCGFKGTKHALGRIKNYDVRLEDTVWNYPVIDFYVMHLDTFFNSFHRKDFI